MDFNYGIIPCYGNDAAVNDTVNDTVNEAVNAEVNDAVNEDLTYYKYPDVNMDSKSYLVIKRFMDIILSLLFLMFLSPIIMIITILIIIDSGRPAFYKQERCGLSGKPFIMYKYRSMIIYADKIITHLKDLNEVQGHMFKIKNDPRITRIGSFIRRTSIDEIPQFLNVLKGEMSIVGPRPPLITEVAQYSPWHMQRLSIKPGITGLWQVSGRNKLGFDDMVKLDLKYIKERNIWLDIRIMIKTVFIFMDIKSGM